MKLSLPQYDFSVPTRFAGITLEDWRLLWRNIGSWKRAEQWFYGDLFNAGRPFVTQAAAGRAMLEEDWAMETLKLIPHMGIEGKTLVNWGYVAMQFPARSRFAELTWSHHREVLHLAPAQRKKLLQRAVDEEWAVADLREAAAPERIDAEPDVPQLAFVPRLFVQQSVRFLSDVRREDAERITALRTEFAPVIQQFKRLGLV